MQQHGIEVVLKPFVDTLRQHLELHGARYQFVVLSRVQVASALYDIVRELAPQARIVFDTVDLHFLRFRRHAELLQDPALKESAQETQEQELSLATNCDAVLVVSDSDSTILGSLSPESHICVVSNIHRVQHAQRSWSERENLLFVANFTHQPNADGLLYFLERIFPIIRKKIPGISLSVIGKNPPESVLRFQASDVEFLGYVKNLDAIYHSTRLSVAPLRFGAGVKGKITMSMSYGVPVVTTSIGAEGIPHTDGENIVIGNTPQEFANAVYRAYTDEQLWNQLSRAGQATVLRHFSEHAARRNLKQLLSWLALEKS